MTIITIHMTPLNNKPKIHSQLFEKYYIQKKKNAMKFVSLFFTLDPWTCIETRLNCSHLSHSNLMFLRVRTLRFGE